MYTPSLIFFHWNDIYDAMHIRPFIDFISSADLQHELIIVQVVFIFFTVAMLAALMYFYANSSYIYWNFLQGLEQANPLQSQGTKAINKSWDQLIKKIEAGTEQEYKLAIIEADALLQETLQDRGYKADTFEELVTQARAKTTFEDVIPAHEVRNAVVYDPNYHLDLAVAKKTLGEYEQAIKSILSS